MKTTITLIFIMIGSLTVAQTTAIPDPNFEQALIDLGIDSDATVNGQVLTSDIAVVQVLDVSDHINITNITGIEDFSALKVLNISYTGIYGNELSSNTLDLTALSNLEELYMNSGGDAISVLVEHLDLSNNPNLKIVHASDVWSLLSINLKSSDLQLNNLDLNAPKYFDENPGSVCISVTNPTQAENGQGVYATWNTCCNLTYSSDCNLGTAEFAKNEIQLYPNPATKVFQVNSQQEIKSITIYNLQSELVKSYDRTQESYSVADLAKGLYLIEIRAVGYQKQVLKFIKK